MARKKNCSECDEPLADHGSCDVCGTPGECGTGWTTIGSAVQEGDNPCGSPNIDYTICSKCVKTPAAHDLLG